jgi:hypothetical protein
MRGLLLRFVREEGGFVSGPEWAFVATILVLGAITAAVFTRHAAERELEPAAAVSDVAPGR